MRFLIFAYNNSLSARYYNSDLSVWISVDPLVDKYPNLSPYTYCAGNPVRIFDEDGMWNVEINEDDTCVMFKTEEGDDLNTLKKDSVINIPKFKRINNFN
ncbi:MAG: hypothetical protein IJT51_08290 [Bacteroidales bacterium]|nr:hypothetical protein [Bacteroidales bacterium]